MDQWRDSFASSAICIIRASGHQPAQGVSQCAGAFMAEGGLEIANWPNLLAWSERIKAMPGYAAPYDLIPKKDREIDPG